MYPALHENQAWAKSAAEDAPDDLRQYTDPTTSTRPMAYPSGTSHTYTRSHRSSTPHGSHYHNAAYFPNWRIHDGYTPATLLNPAQITHIYYAYAAVDYDGTVRLADDKADIELIIDGAKGGLRACTAMRSRHPHLKVLLSIGGPNGLKAFPYVAANPPLRTEFARSLRILTKIYELDGVDIDWDCPTNSEQSSDLCALVAATRGFLPTEDNYIITVSLPATKSSLEKIELDQLRFMVDYINLKAHGFYDRSRSQSAYHAQLLTPTLPSVPRGLPSCQSAVDTIESKSFPLKRVILQIPCYGLSFVGASGPWQPFREVRTVAYKDLPASGSNEHVDSMAGSAFCSDDKSWISYDSHETVRTKAIFVRLRRLAGLSYWDATDDKKGSKSLIQIGHENLQR